MKKPYNDEQLMELVFDIVQQALAIYTSIDIDSFDIDPDMEISSLYQENLDQFEKCLFRIIDELRNQGYEIYLDFEREDLLTVFQTMNDVYLYFVLKAKNKFEQLLDEN